MKTLRVVDREVLILSEMARNILSHQISLIGQLLKHVGNKRKDNVSVVGINVLMVGAESISLEIIEGVSNGHIITPLLSLRTLFEIYINIYIFNVPYTTTSSPAFTLFSTVKAASSKYLPR